MFIEVPNIEKIKNKELFDIIKKELKSKEAYYYKISNNIIYTFQSKKKSNLLLRKLSKKIFERGEKNFIILAKNLYDEDNVMDIFVYMNKKVVSNSYKLELGSFLSIIANNKPSKNEEYKIYYINDEKISGFVPKIQELTSLKEDVFIPVELEFNKEDEKEILKEVSIDDQVKKIKTQLTDINDKYKEKITEGYKVNKKIVLSVCVLIFLGINSVFLYNYYLDYQKQKEEEQLFIEEQERMKTLALQKLQQSKIEEERKKKEEELKKVENEKKFQENFLVLLKKNMEIYEFLQLTKEMNIDYVQIKSNNTMELVLRNKDNLKYFDYKDMTVMDNVIILSNINVISTLEKLKEHKKITNNYLDYYKNIVIPELDEKITKVNEMFGSFEKSNNNIFSFQKNIILKDVEVIFKNNRHDLNIYLQNQNDGSVKLFISEDEDIITKMEKQKQKELELENKINNTKKMNIN